MKSQHIGGIVLLLIGASLILIGMHAPESATQRFGSLFAGEFAEATVWYLIGGLAWALVGALWFTFGEGEMSRHRRG